MALKSCRRRETMRPCLTNCCMGFYVGVEGHIKFDDGTQGTFSSKGLDTSKVGDLDIGTIVPVRYDAGGAGRRRRRRPGEGE